ncbi:MAG: ATP-dependent zinc metalloprotease FtsH [Thermodesulfobacteriota bacterium]
MNQFYKNIALWLVISLVMILLFNMMTKQETQKESISYTAFVSALESDRIEEVVIQGSNIDGVYKDGTHFTTFAPSDTELIKELRQKDVVIEAKPEEDRSFWMTMLVSWGPILLLIAVWIFFMRQMQGGGGKAMNFGKSKARLLTDTQGQVTFKDVAGVDEAKEELEEIVAFLKDPKKFTRLGGRIPKGVLLVGSPGTGKTLLARSIAGEADVPFFTISGSDFVEMFVGVGASRVRDLFAQGKKNAPCIIFIDEIDAVGRHRGAGMGGGHDEREQTLNQLLVEMDGFESNEGVILIAATNRPDVLDPALLRPGRFDRQVIVPLPDVRGRTRILNVHSSKIPVDESLDMEIIAKGTPGFSGADLANLVNEAALLAARENKDTVGMRELEFAKDKVWMGAERRSMVITEKEKKITAYHEAGHALVAIKTPGSDPVHKVSIIPRGRALGVTMYLPTEENYSHSKEDLLGTLASLLGGRAAEEYFLESVTTGASNDIERVTNIARKMVCEWGMSEKLGTLSFGEKEGEVFLGKEMNSSRNYSESTSEMIDAEIKSIVSEVYDRTRQIVKDNAEVLERMAQELLEHETIDSKDIERILAGEPRPADEDHEKADSAQSVKTEAESMPEKESEKTIPRDEA